jgi:hypothetical protein
MQSHLKRTGGNTADATMTLKGARLAIQMVFKFVTELRDD